LNGTCNFILTGMSETGRSYAECLADAQRQGFAEADPTLDVDGTDAAHKLAILAQIAFGATIPFESISRRGIDGIAALDIRCACGRIVDIGRGCASRARSRVASTCRPASRTGRACWRRWRGCWRSITSASPR